jgi:phosphatidylinositol alpha-1,6-mannosyltransferase
MDNVRKLRMQLITRNLPPLVGGMEQLNWHLVDQLRAAADVVVVGPEGAAALAPPATDIREVPLQPLWRFLLVATRRAMIIARQFRPDVVFGGSGLMAPMTWMSARLVGAKAAIYLHGLDIAMNHPLYRWFWLPFLRRMDLVFANSGATRAIAMAHGIPVARIAIVHPGVVVPSTLPDRSPERVTDAITGSGGSKVLLSVGRLSNRKGLCEFVGEVLPLIVQRYPDVMLLIVGGVPKDALHAKAQTPEMIMDAARRAGVSDHLRFLGVVVDRQHLADLYQGSDLHVFPVRTIPGDPEGFGMVAVEAAAFGVPTVAYATGGVVDAVADGVSGRLVAPGQSQAFADAVVALLRCPPPREQVWRHAQTYDWSQFGHKVFDALCNLTSTRSS